MSDLIKNGDRLGPPAWISGVLGFCSQARSASVNVLGQHLWGRNPRCPRDDPSQKPSLYGHLTDGKIESQRGRDLPKATNYVSGRIRT